jgi:type IX secretion system PorP/SprF family membrane protein
LIKINILKIFPLFLILGSVISTNAQDIHFSQFYFSPMNLNPALTGVFPQDIRISGIYRKQWQSVPVPYMTFSGAYDTKIFNKISENGFFGAGIIFNYDKQGYGSFGGPELKLAQLTLSGSYTQRLNDNNLLTAGVQVGTINRAFSVNGLQFENQYNGDIFNPGLPSREDFDRTSITFLDYSTGLNWHLQTDAGLSLNAGVGLFHLTQPKQNFYNQSEARLSMRYAVNVMGKAPLNPLWNIHFVLLFQKQGVYNEMLTGAAAEYKLNVNRGKELSVQLGTNFRYADESDAVIPTFGVKYLSWQLGISYDVNISQFKTATNGSGGPEIAVVYTITKVKPPKTFKACPIF